MEAVGRATLFLGKISGRLVASFGTIQALTLQGRASTWPRLWESNRGRSRTRAQTDDQQI
eukprot:11150642-Prorocentrum_lima.AAC.1